MTENKVSRCAREDISNVKIMLLAYIIKIILNTYLINRVFGNHPICFARKRSMAR